MAGLHCAKFWDLTQFITFNTATKFGKVTDLVKFQAVGCHNHPHSFGGLFIISWRYALPSCPTSFKIL